MKPLSDKAIVILDDEKSYLDLLSRLLSDHLSHPIVTFTRPLEALDALPGLNVGLIVTDYYMPQLNGLEFIQRAQQVKPGVPFIVITGHGLELSEQEHATMPELKTILHKPFGWNKLADEIIAQWPDLNPPTLKGNRPAAHVVASAR